MTVGTALQVQGLYTLPHRWRHSLITPAETQRKAKERKQGESSRFQMMRRAKTFWFSIFKQFDRSTYKSLLRLQVVSDAVCRHGSMRNRFISRHLQRQEIIKANRRRMLAWMVERKFPDRDAQRFISRFVCGWRHSAGYLRCPPSAGSARACSAVEKQTLPV